MHAGGYIHHKAHSPNSYCGNIVWKAKEGASPASGFAQVSRVTTCVRSPRKKAALSPRVCLVTHPPGPVLSRIGTQSRAAGPWPALGGGCLSITIPFAFKCGVMHREDIVICGHKVAITMKRHTFVWRHMQPRRVRLAHTRLTCARGASRSGRGGAYILGSNSR